MKQAFIDIPEPDKMIILPDKLGDYRNWLAQLADNLHIELARKGWRVRLVHEDGIDLLEFSEENTPFAQHCPQCGEKFYGRVGQAHECEQGKVTP